ncbi:MAG TPA: hypothetical protein VGG83_30330, partial [Trebonia sp.]
AVEEVGEGDLQDQRGHPLLVVVPGRLVPDLVGDRVGAVGQPGRGLGQGKGGVWAVRGNVRVAFSFTIAGDGRITVIDLIGDPVALPALEVAFAGS